MTAFGINVEFGRNLGAFQFQKIKSGIFNVHRIVFRLEDERRRSPRGNVDFRIGSEVLFFEREIPRIDEDDEIRAATKFVVRIDEIVSALIEMGAKGGGEVRPG